MSDGQDQIESRIAEDELAARDATGDPAGRVRLPFSGGQVARSMVLAGFVLGLTAMSDAGALGICGGTSCP